MHEVQGSELIGALFFFFKLFIQSFFLFRPPDGCLQYHTGIAGTLKTFNFDEATVANRQHLASQQ